MIRLDLSKIIRTGALLSAGAVLFAGVGAGAGAATTFHMTVRVDDSCTFTDSGPSNLTPAYTSSSDTSTGSASSLNTNCTGSSPTVVFSDAAASGTSVFTMSDGHSHSLTFQISNKPACTGGTGDDPITEGTAQPLASGSGTYDICAAVITGGSNRSAAAGAYTDTVTYTVTP